eukprot:gene23531-28198_t
MITPLTVFPAKSFGNRVHLAPGPHLWPTRDEYAVEDVGRQVQDRSAAIVLQSAGCDAACLNWVMPSTEHSSTPTHDDLNLFAPDVHLADLVRVVNLSDETRFPITLVVSGATISGHVVSGSRFFRGLKHASASEECTDALAGLWDSAIALYSEAQDEEAVDPIVELERIGFIHLEDAVVHTGGTRSGLMFWRGRLESVDGWSMGALNTPS